MEKKKRKKKEEKLFIVIYVNHAFNGYYDSILHKKNSGNSIYRICTFKIIDNLVIVVTPVIPVENK